MRCMGWSQWMTIRIFLDASALFAAAYSSTGAARELLRLSLEKRVQLITNQIAVEEAERNLERKAPEGVAIFWAILNAFPIEVLSTPDITEIPEAAGEYGNGLVSKDAPILAGAVASGAECWRRSTGNIHRNRCRTHRAKAGRLLPRRGIPSGANSLACLQGAMAYLRGVRNAGDRNMTTVYTCTEARQSPGHIAGQSGERRRGAHPPPGRPRLIRRPARGGVLVAAGCRRDRSGHHPRGDTGVYRRGAGRGMAGEENESGLNGKFAAGQLPPVSPPEAAPNPHRHPYREIIYRCHKPH